MSRTGLKALPSFIGGMEQLQDLIIIQNPLEFPPPEIVKQGTSAIKEYLKGFLKQKELSAEPEGAPLYEAKLIVVGEGGVGKTSLCNRLIYHDYNETEPTTEGISIKDWRLLAPNDAGTEIKMNVWDFGGQEIYHSTHQFFLTKRSVYLLVWDARQEDKYAQLDYWLYTIEALGEDSPVLLILNKCDERIRDINLADLKEKFENIREFYRVSCKVPGKTTFEDLEEEIAKTAWPLPQMGDRWIPSWRTVREKLESSATNKNQIPYNEYLTICKENGIGENAANILSGYLHDLGVILHFQKDPLLMNTVILDPEWGTRAVYKVLDARAVIERRGIFLLSDRATIWKKEDGYPPDLHETLVRLMTNFELAFKIEIEPDEYKYLVAELLPMQPIEFEWNYGDNLEFQYQYNFMPAGVMSRFIVKIHHYIEKDDDGNPMCWRLGVILERENTRAYVRLFKDDKRIEVRIVGEDKAGLLQVIREKFASINKRFKKLEIIENIPCRCPEDCRYLFRYDYLKKARNRGKTTVTCQESVQDIPVLTLLEGIKPIDDELPERGKYVSV